MIRRNFYLNQITPFIDKDLVKVLIGVRRSGKSTLLAQIQELLRNKGVLPEQILNINYESKQFDNYKTSDALYEFVTSWRKNKNEKVYLFFDEIQEVEDWEESVNSFRVDFDCDIYITGSNSKLLSGELATYLRGRYVSFTVYPFSFHEAKELALQKNTFTTNEALFANYVKLGGFPQRFELPTEQSVKTYLSDLYDTIVLKDIMERNKIRNTVLLRKLVEFLINNIGNVFSANSIVKKLKGEGVKTNVETILSYLDAITRSFAISAVPRYNISGKQLLESNEKYYCVDLGFHTLLRKNDKMDVGHLYENIVYSELLSRGWSVSVGKLNQCEIDFVCTRGEETIFVQVAYLITESDIEREFGNLKLIQNNYPKYVISADLIDLSLDGIVHKNIINFLLEE
ncbi:MAG TPA: ATP-binding protein [Paludibacteraceae bacterium]|nr:ATP-binding protein [Paludibacteraceae bacterium]